MSILRVGSTRSYTTISSAISDAVQGDVIIVDPGSYTGFTVSKNDISIVGLGSCFYDNSTNDLTGGVIVTSSSGGGTAVNFTMSNINFQCDVASDVWACGASQATQTTILNHTYLNCKFVGSGYNNSYHAFLNQSGSHITIDKCQFFNSTHGLALRCANVNASNLYFSDCGGGSSIIIKGDTGSGNAEFININNVRLRAKTANACANIIIQNVHSSTLARFINISNVVADTNMNTGLIRIQETAGSTYDISINNCSVVSTYSHAYQVDAGSNISFNNCHARLAGGYSFEIAGGSRISITNSTSISPVSGHIRETVPVDILQLNGEFKTRKGADVASVAGAITLGDGNVFVITGTNTITSITAKPAGTEVTLIFSSTAGLTDGSNLKLAGSLSATADDVIKLVCDGTNWYEVCRSIN